MGGGPCDKVPLSHYLAQKAFRERMAEESKTFEELVLGMVQQHGFVTVLGMVFKAGKLLNPKMSAEFQVTRPKWPKQKPDQTDPDGYHRGDTTLFLAANMHDGEPGMIPLPAPNGIPPKEWKAEYERELNLDILKDIRPLLMGEPVKEEDYE